MHLEELFLLLQLYLKHLHFLNGHVLSGPHSVLLLGLLPVLRTLLRSQSSEELLDLALVVDRLFCELRVVVSLAALRLLVVLRLKAQLVLEDFDHLLGCLLLRLDHLQALL